MAHPLGELGEATVIARVGDVIADAAIEGRMTPGEDPRQAARRIASGIAGGVLEASRPEIAAHSEDVSIVAGAIARWLGVAGQRLEDILVAACLHDIGKLAIPGELLDKQTPFDPIEWVAIRRHTIVGERILVSVPELRGAARLVRHSHERWDGFGYPDGLLGEAIPLGSRIIACADAYAAMRGDRAYRAGFSTAEALEEIRACAGTQFDPAVVEALEALAGGLHIAADRVRPRTPRAARLVALLLVVAVGGGGAALARSGLISNPNPEHGSPPSGTELQTIRGGSAPVPAGVSGANPGSRRRVPSRAGTADPEGPSQPPVLEPRLGAPALAVNPDNGQTAGAGTQALGGKLPPGASGNGQGGGLGPAQVQGQQTGQQLAPGQQGQPAHGNGAGKAHPGSGGGPNGGSGQGKGNGAPNPRQPNSASPGQSPQSSQAPGQAGGAGNGNGGGSGSANTHANGQAGNGGGN